MKLYLVPKNSKIRLLEEGDHPPDDRETAVGESFTFKGIDGMYGKCDNSMGRTYLAAWTEVEVVEGEAA